MARSRLLFRHRRQADAGRSSCTTRAPATLRSAAAAPCRDAPTFRACHGADRRRAGGAEAAAVASTRRQVDSPQVGARGPPSRCPFASCAAVRWTADHTARTHLVAQRVQALSPGGMSVSHSGSSTLRVCFFVGAVGPNLSAMCSTPLRLESQWRSSSGRRVRREPPGRTVKRLFQMMGHPAPRRSRFDDRCDERVPGVDGTGLVGPCRLDSPEIRPATAVR